MQFLKFKSCLPAAALAVLCSCSTFDEEKITLDGERISVLDGETALQPDYAPGQVKIVLPAPYTNTAWSQNGGNATHMMGHLSSDSKLKELWESGFGEGSSKRDFLIAALRTKLFLRSTPTASLTPFVWTTAVRYGKEG